MVLTDRGRGRGERCSIVLCFYINFYFIERYKFVVDKINRCIFYDNEFLQDEPYLANVEILEINTVMM